MKASAASATTERKAEARPAAKTPAPAAHTPPAPDKPQPRKASAPAPAPKKADAAPPGPAASPAKAPAAHPAPAKAQPAAPPPAPAAATPVAPAPVQTTPAADPPRPVPPQINGRPAPISRASNKDETFAEGDYVVYPTHGVGRVERIAEEEIAGHRLQLIHITFEENRMTLRVPVAKARSAGLRKLATRKLFDEALAVLKGRARIKRTMWSRRAQEYEAKINSGDPLAIAEVVRDLHRNAGQPDQSFSERQIYESAMDRLAAELAALDQTDKTTAATKLANFLKTIA